MGSAGLGRLDPELGRDDVDSGVVQADERRCFLLCGGAHIECCV